MTPDRRETLRKAARIGGVALLLLGGGVEVFRLLSDNSRPVKQEPFKTTFKLTLPPPPPPPPPPPQPPPPQKMLEQPKVTNDPQPAPAKAAPKTPNKPQPNKPSASPSPPGNPLTAEAGPGANPYGLQAGNGDGNTIGGGGGGGGGGSQFGFYASLVQSQVQAALGRDEATRSAHYRARVRIWLNAAGQITRVSLVSATGDREVDGPVLQRVLGGVTAGQALPANMPMPIVLSIAES